jgi:hypothetical protein
MDNLSITNSLVSTAPVGEVQSRRSTGGKDETPGKRRFASKQEIPEEDETLIKDEAEDHHALDEEA